MIENIIDYVSSVYLVGVLSGILVTSLFLLFYSFGLSKIIKGTAAILWFPIRAVVALAIIVVCLIPFVLMGSQDGPRPEFFETIWRWDLIVRDFVISFY